MYHNFPGKYIPQHSETKILYLNEIHSSIFYSLWETDPEKEDYQAETNSCIQHTQIYASLHFK